MIRSDGYSINICTCFDFFWLQSFTYSFLNNVLALVGSEENYNRVMSEYGKKVDTTRGTAIQWVAMPVGWLIASYLLTDRMGCDSFVIYAAF